MTINNAVQEGSDNRVPIPTITTAILTKVVEYFKMHGYDPPMVVLPITSSDLAKILPALDLKFVRDIKSKEELL